MKQRMQQGGSVVGFLVTCAVLAALLIGGIYFVRHQGWFGTHSASVATSDTDNGTDSNKDDTTPTEQSSDKADNKDEPTKDAPATVPSDDDSSDTAADSSIPTTGQTATELPQTGPVDAILSLIGAGTLAATVAAYVRSRRLI